MVYRHYFSIILLLTISIVVSWGFYFNDYQRKDIINIKDFPRSVDHWTSEELPIDKTDLAVLETKNAFLRRYTNAEGKYVYLYIAYSQSNPKATNPPEVFYRASGISIIDKSKEFILIDPSYGPITVNCLLLDENSNRQIAYYWFKVGDTYTHSYWKQRALATFNNLIGKRTTGSALIRISADMVNGHQKETVKLINEFASLIGPQLSQY